MMGYIMTEYHILEILSGKEKFYYLLDWLPIASNFAEICFASHETWFFFPIASDTDPILSSWLYRTRIPDTTSGDPSKKPQKKLLEKLLDLSQSYLGFFSA